MTYSQFATEKPVLYGQIMYKGKSKIGSFKPLWQALSNSLIYAYHLPNGKKSTGGFTLKRAFSLFEAGRLTTNPAHGNPENYL